MNDEALQKLADNASQQLQDCYEWHKAGVNYDLAEGSQIVLSALTQAVQSEREKLQAILRELDAAPDGRYSPHWRCGYNQCRNKVAVILKNDAALKDTP
jgi:hypothetical protein